MKVRRHQLPRVRKKPPSPAPVSVDANADCQTIVVQAPVAEVYRRCLHFEEFPRFISSIREIDRIDDTSFSCTIVIRGRETHSRVTLIMRVPDRRIAWETVSDDFGVGVVFLDPLASGSTRLTVKVRAILEPVMLTGALRRYLRNFKRFVERQPT
jgi:uncharacterized membrane protein